MKEVKEWLEKAEKDLKRAKLLFSNEDFEDCAFHAQQAAEEALEALYILEFKRLWKIHDLEKLCLSLKANKILKPSKELTIHYIETRYPVKVEYTEEIARKALKNAEKVMKWVRKKIEKIEESVRKFKNVVEKKFAVEKIIIFGSAARGEMRRDSDIDLIVVSRKYGRRDVFKITPKLYGIWHEKERIDYPVDIILFNVKEFEKLKKQVSIVSEALREGIEI